MVLVEGQTEEVAVKRVLDPALWGFNITLIPTIVTTKRVAAGPNHKGGMGSWSKVSTDLRLLTRDTNAAAITTMFDYYGLPSDAPGMANRPNADAYQRVKHVEAAIDASVSDQRFRSSLVLHEFEALLYSEPAVCGTVMMQPAVEAVMRTALQQSGGPELVNDSANTAPSKRLLAAHPTYSKTLDGPNALLAIGLPAVRAACPHFDEWVTWLESLG